MALNSLTGEDWTKRTARIGFPILVEYARARRSISYGEWDAEIVRRGLGKHVFLPQYGHPAGSIGDACEEYGAQQGRPIPTINLMVVQKNSGLPGSGADPYIKKFCRDYNISVTDPTRLSAREKRAIIERAQDEIFDFEGWSDVLMAYGLGETGRGAASKRKRRRPDPGKWHTGPESDAHKELKSRIAGSPEMVGLPEDQKGREEYRLWSGDEVDVYFERSAVAVEVKARSAGFDESHRGIFQCVKYKAVLRAQQIHDRRIPTADCMLAIGGKLHGDLLSCSE